MRCCRREWSHIRSVWRTAAIFFSGLSQALGQSGHAVGAAAFGDWRSDEPGLRRIIKPNDLPKPGAAPSVANFPHVLPRVSHCRPASPSRFQSRVIRRGVERAYARCALRLMATFSSQKLTRAESRLRAAMDNLKPSANGIFASGLNQPFGIAFFRMEDNPQWVYVGNTDSVIRFPYAVGDIEASGKPEIIVAGLPSGGSHSTRNLVFTRRQQADVGIGWLQKQ